MNNNSLLVCLSLYCQQHQLAYAEAKLLEGLPLECDLTVDVFPRAALNAGVDCRLELQALNDMQAAFVPFIALGHEEAFLVTAIDAYNVSFIRPSQTMAEQQLTLEDFSSIYSGEVFLLKNNEQYVGKKTALFDQLQQHWFWGTLLRSRTIYRDVFLASILINVFAIASPLFVMNVYDRVVPNAAIETLWALVVGITVVVLSDYLIKKLRYEFLEVAGKKSDILLSANTFSKTLAMSMSNKPQAVGSYASNLREFDSVRQFISSSTLLVLADFPFVILFLLVIYFIAGSLVIVPFFVLPLILLYGLVAQYAMQQTVSKTYELNANKNALLIESLQSLEQIKCLGGQSQLQRQWEQSTGQIAHWTQQSRMIASRTTFFCQLVQQLSMVGTVVYGVYLIAELELSMGALIATVMLSGRIAQPMAQLASLLASYQQSKTAYQSMQQIMAQPTENEIGSQISRRNLKGDIQFDQVSFGYTEKNSILKQVSFRIQSGEKVAIIGRIGSGKTSIARLMLGLYQPQQGAILFDGIDLQQSNLNDIRKQLGYVDQQPTLFRGSLRQNLVYGLGFIEDEQLMDVLASVGLASLVNEHGEGLDQPIAEQGASLSGGQRQALVVARALLRDSPIYLLDEPTASMDNLSEQLFARSLSKKLKDKTLVLITHKSSMLEMVDRIIVIDGGRVVADGAKDKVLAALKNGQLQAAV
jgi:ATP-binding cassette subfamily C protein LapB